MSTQYMGELRIMSFAFAPKNWALCNGQILSIAQNQALFSLLGTTYGGNGVTTFALPDMRTRTPLHQGSNGGQLLSLGEIVGQYAHTLIASEMPQHTHLISASATDAGDRSPAGERFAVGVGGINEFAAGANGTALAPEAVTAFGGGQPHNNLQPYLTVTFIIALQGIFPQRP